MSAHVCPWWLGSLLASPLRRIVQDPREILSPFVREGMTVLEPGPGMGFFTVELARLVGPGGRVVAVDLQPQMLDGLRRRLSKAGFADRVELRKTDGDSLGVSDCEGKVDFALAFAMVHEVGDKARFFAELGRALKPGGRVLFSEPARHVSQRRFRASLELASDAALNVVETPTIRWNRSALLARG